MCSVVGRTTQAVSNRVSLICNRSEGAELIIFLRVFLGVFILPFHSMKGEESLAANSQWLAAKDLLNKRCVACHSCNSSPCQIDLGSFDGIMRGGNSDLVYNGTRLLPMNPSRLFIDAKSSQEWEKKFGFYPIVNQKKPQNSLLLRVTAKDVSQVDDPSKIYTTKVGQVCPDEGQWAWYKKLHSWRKMPFGFPALSEKEQLLLAAWGKSGFPGEFVNEKALVEGTSSQEKKSLGEWEAFLNGDSLKGKLVARYLFEHLFLAHLDLDPGTSLERERIYFRLVRSRTASPQPIDEIASRRPFDDPGRPTFYYRLRPMGSTVMHKSHILFPFGSSELKKIKKSFLDSAWVDTPQRIASYGPEAANPFIVFKALPLQARYRFFLENAQYFTMSFIRGPVCEGQIAVNVIQDHFHVAFMDPRFDLSVNDPTYLVRASAFLGLPAQGGNSPIETYYGAYKDFQLDYVKFRARAYANAKLTYSLESIWDGDGSDQDAGLTIFRHFDNASVIKGFWGGFSKTVWIMDYPIFERMYYLLVAGFDVFGNVFHQASTRLYMDNLRIESENNFIYLLPQARREVVRQSWYQGKGASEKLQKENPLFSSSYPSTLEKDLDLNDKEKDPETIASRLAKRISQDRLKSILNQSDPYGCCIVGEAPRPADSSDLGLVDENLRRLSAKHSSFARFLPESMLLLISDLPAQGPQLYFLSKLSEHLNVAFLLEEDERLDPENDRLIVTKDWVGSYPNYFLVMKASELASFTGLIEKANTKASVKSLLKSFGRPRNHPLFWQTYDEIDALLKKSFPRDYGQLDLSRYENIFELAR